MKELRGALVPSLRVHLHSLAMVREGCLRAIASSGRLCVNIGDQFTRAPLYGRCRVTPLHTEMVCQTCTLGFNIPGSIVWHERTLMDTTGGALVMGSFPCPPSGIIELERGRPGPVLHRAVSVHPYCSPELGAGERAGLVKARVVHKNRISVNDHLMKAVLTVEKTKLQEQR
ncbi:MAG: hypothetical protein NT005_01730 [Spirochaetes bacterium]|nr:hypothetical protein [Spirochaetota bacterium]